MARVLEEVVIDSAWGLPSTSFAKAFVIFSGFMIPVSAQVIFLLPEEKVDLGLAVQAKLFFCFLPVAIVHVSGTVFVCKIGSSSIDVLLKLKERGSWITVLVK